jgi:transcriptional regulator with XRE-family HTH domain
MMAERRIQIAVMSLQDRVSEYLGRCNRRGSRYRQDLDTCPNIRQLAKYCECDPTTILRIANGTTQAPSLRNVSIIAAVAGISPAPYQSDASAECRARVDDANQWLKDDPESRGDILDVIVAGVQSRIGRTLKSIN